MERYRVGVTRRARGEKRFPSWRARWALSIGIVVINLFGAVLVYCLAAFVVPIPPVPDDDRVRMLNLIATAIYGGTAIIAGVIHFNIKLTPLVRWIRAGAHPDDPGRLTVLRTPQMIAVRQGLAWLLAAAIFGGMNATVDVRLGIDVALIVALAGWSTTAFVYLAAERALRGFARKALEGGAQPPRHRSVVRRAMTSWGLGTGVVLLGSVLVGLFTLIEPTGASKTSLAISMVVFGGIGLMVGGLAAYLAARASADPLRALRTAVQQVERGDYDVQIPIYDATEIGHLQAGFNQMASGLRERETLRDLFGRHVGEEVARNALAGGVELGGETREVAVLFVDIVGSTTIAHDREPEEVVTLLNRFFAVVIDVVDAHDGWINKFEGDAALAVWGAPTAVPDQATTVLRAARVMGERLRDEVPELQAGIGVSAGRAVAGNIGAAQRSEYTVIGDPVNEASRLTDLSKGVPLRVMARADLLDAADPSEASRWERLEPVVVRGRTTPTPVATPAS